LHSAAVELHNRFILASNCQPTCIASGECTCDRKKDFKDGRCAGVLSMPSTMTQLLEPGGKLSIVPRPLDGGAEWHPGMNTTGRKFWYPGVNENRSFEEAVAGADNTYWGRRARMPGTHVVWDHVTPGTLVKCTKSNCPKAVSDPLSNELINFAAYFSEGGEAYAMRASSDETKKTMLWDLFTWFAGLDVTELPLAGQYRRSHLTDEARERLVMNSGFPPTMADDLLQVLRQYFAEEETEKGNPVQDLLLIGFSEYMGELQNELYTNFLFSPAYRAGNVTFDEYYPTFLANLNRGVGYLLAHTKRDDHLPWCLPICARAVSVCFCDTA